MDNMAGDSREIRKATSDRSLEKHRGERTSKRALRPLGGEVIVRGTDAYRNLSPVNFDERAPNTLGEESIPFTAALRAVALFATLATSASAGSGAGCGWPSY
jgi:hypothetical protein